MSKGHPIQQISLGYHPTLDIHAYVYVHVRVSPQTHLHKVFDNNTSYNAKFWMPAINTIMNKGVCTTVQTRHWRVEPGIIKPPRCMKQLPETESSLVSTGPTCTHTIKLQTCRVQKL